jgi:hypothetical protein
MVIKINKQEELEALITDGIINCNGEDLIINCNVSVNANIINAWDIDVWDIKAGNI